MRFKRSQTTSHGIDISPLIDMVFILLIFFMVSTTFNQDMQLDLTRPGAASAVSSSKQSIRVFIDQRGEVYINKQPVKIWTLQSRIRELTQADPNQPVLVVTDKGVPAERLIEVVDQCRLGGAKDVGVATEKEAGV